MTLHFKVITNSNASAFEKDVNDFMENNDIMDVKYSSSNSGFSAFIMYCSREETMKVAQEQLDMVNNTLNKLNAIKMAHHFSAEDFIKNI